MIQSIFPKIKALIIDMDGVLWRAEQPIGDLPAIFQRIEEMGLKTIFATNNSTRTVEKYVERLHQFGIETDQEQIVTSSIATTYLQKHRLQDRPRPHWHQHSRRSRSPRLPARHHRR
jgi:ribonucleotide monophosphatase NagD (HAD superfamily)